MQDALKMQMHNVLIHVTGVYAALLLGDSENLKAEPYPLYEGPLELHYREIAVSKAG